MNASHQHYMRHNSALSTLPGLSISTSTSCASSIHTTSHTDIACSSPYYYYSSPSSSPTTISHGASQLPLQSSYRPLDKRSQSVSVRLRRRTSSSVSPPQRSASACSTLLKEVSLVHHHHLSAESPINPVIRHSAIDVVPAARDDLSPPPPPQQQQWWDDSQLALELADDLPPNHLSSTSHRNIKTKLHQWFLSPKKQPFLPDQSSRRRHLFSKWRT
ncbi:hypothetical protein [Absidia glauca]|uniref:Uncharacterized protein n=1 Tax=Absidia glauca TaxID=4829 RepID=A0A168PGI1_ABSGL|nr:hypothetical protein [Absidia glauca]